MQLYVLPGTTLADVYGAGSFGDCAYNSATSCSSSGSSSGSSGSGTLANTGIAVAAILTLACMIALAAIVVRFWRRPAKKQSQSQQARRRIASIPVSEDVE
jgi:hypothetical protein